MAAEHGDPDIEFNAQRQARYLTGLLWHVGSFVILNAAFWLLDAATGGGITWAFWITALWGLALLFHTLAYLIDGRQVEARMTEQHLRDRQRADTGSQDRPDGD